jgi:rhomboid family GlyGly-CTERM serine protease
VETEIFMIKLPLQFKYIIGPILIMLMAFTLDALEPVSSQWFRYIRENADSGEYWRLFTGNLVQSNFTHVLLNMAGVFFAWLLHAEHYSVKRYFAVWVLCCVGCGIGVHWLSPYDEYVGLSGAIHGLITYGAIMDIKKGDKTGWLLLIGICAKVAYENIIGASESVKEMIGTNVAVEAHLYGLVTGLVIALPIIYQWLKYGEDVKTPVEQTP